MKKLTTRLPAREGLGMSELADNAVSVKITELLFKMSGLSGNLYKIKGSTSELEGYYRLENGTQHLFLKVLPDTCLVQQNQANDFAVFVQQAGILTNQVLPGFPKYIDTSLVLFAYEWIDGRCLEPKPSELEQFGRQLAVLHQALLGYPEQEMVKKNTISRLATLREIADEVVSLNNTGSRYLQRLTGLLKNKPDIFSQFSEPCQVLHGDLNIGNLRYCESGVVFLDFEDAIHSWFPRRIDVAFALERLALINEPNSSLALDNAKALLRGYVNNTESSPFLYAGSFKDSLEWLSIRSLCMLQQFEWQGKPWPESEWKKFDKLLDHIQMRSDLMLELEAYFIK